MVGHGVRSEDPAESGGPRVAARGVIPGVSGVGGVIKPELFYNLGACASVLLDREEADISSVLVGVSY